MKKIVFVIIFCLPGFCFGQNDSIHIEQLKKEIALEAKPVYVNALAQIMKLREDVELAKKGLLKKSDVIKSFNDTVGGVMGKQTTFAGVEKRLKDGDSYAQFLFLKEEARISYLKAAEAKYESEKNN